MSLVYKITSVLYWPELSWILASCPGGSLSWILTQIIFYGPCQKLPYSRTQCQFFLMIGNLKSEIEKKEGNVFIDFHIVDNNRHAIKIYWEHNRHIIDINSMIERIHVFICEVNEMLSLKSVLLFSLNFGLGSCTSLDLFSFLTKRSPCFINLSNI